MSYDWFNKQEILQKAKEKHPKEKAGEYYSQNKEAIKKKDKRALQKLVTRKKDKIKEYQRKRYQQLI